MATGTDGMRGSQASRPVPRAAGARATTAVSPYQARALTRPASPATGTVTAIGSWPMTAAATDKIAKSASSHPAAAAEGSLRHQALAIPPWLSGSATSSMTGNVARKGQEKGRIATPSARLATGEMSRQANTVKPRAQRKAGSGAGARPAAGQASRTSTAFTAERARIRPASSRVNSSQDRCAL
jgi:hypothetical protein